MPLDPQARAYLDTQVPSEPPRDAVSLAKARADFLNRPDLAGEPPVLGGVEDRQIPGPESQVAIRMYTPQGKGPFPLLVYFHGGGWVFGNLDVHDTMCRILTNAVNCIIVSVDYRLAPEHKFPAAPEDCYAATRWVAENAAGFNGDPRRIAVCGDSAGGNLATAVALMARDRGGPRLVYQVLIYPITNYSFDTPSYQDKTPGYSLTKDEMVWFWEQYLAAGDDGKHPYASPLQAQDLRSLPPAMVITAEYDPLLDEGEQYAARLQEVGNRVTLRRYNGMIHGFFSKAAVMDQGKRAMEDAATCLRSAFADEYKG
jgi:acetyl esterase/lipase